MGWKADVARWRAENRARLVQCRGLLLAFGHHSVLKRIFVNRLLDLEEDLSLPDEERWWPSTLRYSREAVAAFQPPLGATAELPPGSSALLDRADLCPICLKRARERRGGGRGGYRNSCRQCRRAETASPARRLGYVPCPSCGGRKVKSACAAGLARLSCSDPFHGAETETK
jgi:hypothetical protein